MDIPSQFPGAGSTLPSSTCLAPWYLDFGSTRTSCSWEDPMEEKYTIDNVKAKIQDKEVSHGVSMGWRRGQIVQNPTPVGARIILAQRTRSMKQDQFQSQKHLLVNWMEGHGMEQGNGNMAMEWMGGHDDNPIGGQEMGDVGEHGQGNDCKRYSLNSKTITLDMGYGNGRSQRSFPEPKSIALGTFLISSPLVLLVARANRHRYSARLKLSIPNRLFTFRFSNSIGDELLPSGWTAFCIQTVIAATLFSLCDRISKSLHLRNIPALPAWKFLAQGKIQSRSLYTQPMLNQRQRFRIIFRTFPARGEHFGRRCAIFTPSR
ncbi:hypothetical protein TWF281_007510 [Arthrobotrys megalospora]